MHFSLENSDIVRKARETGGQNLLIECICFYLVSVAVSAAVKILTGLVCAAALYCSSSPQAGQALVRQLKQILPMAQIPLTILIALAYCKWVQKRPLPTMGLRKQHWLSEYALGGFLGMAMMTGIILICLLTGSIRIVPGSACFGGSRLFWLFLCLLAFLIQGFSEEILFRGYFLTSLLRKERNPWLAIAFSALAFSGAHLLNSGLNRLALLNLFLFGVFAGVYLLKRGSLWGIAALHSLWNFTQGNLWGIRVSGSHFGPSLVEMEVSENLALLNGGFFGMEGGLLCSFVLLAGILILLRLPQKETA